MPELDRRPSCHPLGSDRDHVQREMGASAGLGVGIRHLQRDAGWGVLRVVLHPDLMERSAIREIVEIQGHFDNVVERGALRCQEGLHSFERVARLLLGVIRETVRPAPSNRGQE